ncbi:MAG: histidine kinase dimerization/phospho-acceptor domain-containing protein, partial [Rikenellaceae bacterium]
MRENINGTVHDLKTPLSGVVMALNLAKTNTEDEQIKNIFSLSLSSVHHLIGNIDSLLSVARKNNTLHKEDITTLELLGIIGTIVSDLDNIYTKKPHTIEVNNLLPNGTKFN